MGRLHRHLYSNFFFIVFTAHPSSRYPLFRMLPSDVTQRPSSASGVRGLAEPYLRCTRFILVVCSFIFLPFPLSFLQNHSSSPRVLKCELLTNQKPPVTALSSSATTFASPPSEPSFPITVTPCDPDLISPALSSSFFGPAVSTLSSCPGSTAPPI